MTVPLTALLLGCIVFNVAIAVAIIAVTIYLLRMLKIQLNRWQTIGYLANLVGITMRMALSIEQETSGNYNRPPWKIYFKWAEDTIFVCFYLNNFSRIIASWLIAQNQKVRLSLDVERMADQLEFEEANAAMLKRVRVLNRMINSALGAFFVISLTLAVLDSVITQQIRTEKREQTNQGLYWAFIAVSAAFMLLNAAIGAKLTHVVTQLNQPLRIKVPLAFFVWCVAISFGAAFLIADAQWLINGGTLADYNTSALKTGFLACSAVHNFLIYCITLLVLWHLWGLNEKTIQLAVSIERWEQAERISIAEGRPSEPLIEEVEIPRKITLFRVVLERKLGIDFEHGGSYVTSIVS